MKPNKTIRYRNLPTAQPPGEDFFVFSVHIKTSDPFYDPGFVGFGEWKQITPVIANWAHQQSRKTLNRVIIKVYQGDNARGILPELFKEELEYQKFIHRDNTQN